jgi:hypothetical protein
MHKLSALLALCAAAGLSAVTRAEAQATCEWYAKTALQQQQRNERNKCGFKGPEWSSDLRAHLAWCAGQSPDRWKAEAQKREQMLAACKK